MIITIIDRARFILWKESLVFDPCYAGHYKDYQWVAENWRESDVYGGGCWMFDLHIISLKSNTVVYFKTHHSMTRDHIKIKKMMEARVQRLLYDTIP